MEELDKIIKVIDNELIKSGKPYLLLRQANQLLLDEKSISISEKSNIRLKKLLEENKIPHAYQTENTPKQWRIPLSKKGEARKKKLNKKTTITTKPLSIDYSFQHNNNIKCSSCGINLLVPPEIIPHDLIKCPNCLHKTQNTLKNNQKKSNLTQTQWAWLVIMVPIFLIAIFLSLTGGFKNSSNSIVSNNPLDNSVYQVETYLKNSYLEDPGSYESIEWSKVIETQSAGFNFRVRHKYRVKNSFGDYEIENKIFLLDENGNVVGEKDVH
jgi:DNA-directed RNA polymerase subunit RPC12/RpoP